MIPEEFQQELDAVAITDDPLPAPPPEDPPAAAAAEETSAYDQHPAEGEPAPAADTLPAEEAAPAAPTADDWRPPSRQRFGEVMKARAYYKQQAETSAATLAQQQEQHQTLMGEVAKVREAIGAQPAAAGAEEQTPEEVLAELAAAKVQETLGKDVEGLRETLLESKRQQELDTAQTRLNTYIETDRATARQTHPDFDQAIQHAAVRRAEEYVEKNPHLEIADALPLVTEEMGQMVTHAIANGESPGELLYEIATRRLGWVPPNGANGQPAPAPATPATPATPAPAVAAPAASAAPAPAAPASTVRDRLARNTASLSTVPGDSQSQETEVLTRELVSGASQEDFAALMTKHGSEKILNLFALAEADL